MAKAGIAFLIFVAAIVVYAFAHFAQQRADSEAFDAIEMGDSTLDVVNVLGEPDAIRECSENLWWGGDHRPLGNNDGGVLTSTTTDQCPADFRLDLVNLAK